ncbi:SWI/SNF and RSC complex subunit Ssr2 [Tilletia horrida]|uniref:SWI/SNF and RSC complex subunit Ssr2 n=1 Tax=Tilletia horrida TaxID=155126 RepID=A0AAN6GIA8_9BASI|nr:SWI/SNF and RSC complex subunit Ssr2 [Tilletia horrida]KAK0542470.1 SWI/SNF and RSC complex subunit Ssr2 [Tilletia horrida]KAK0558471.1 SWI/SNF and RSC complex subunit Ssr2 [Tilletia horrida]
MPIGDPYLDEGLGSGNTNGTSAPSGKLVNGSAKSVKQSELGMLRYARDPKLGIPCSLAANPVMSVVAFLAGAVSPAVAAAAAQSALEELTEAVRKRVAAEKTAERQEYRRSVSTSTTAAAKEAAELADGKIEVSVSSDAKAAITNQKEQDKNEADHTSKAQQDSPDADGTEAGKAVPRSAVERATAVALEAAAVKAQILANVEERECQRLAEQVIDAQLRKMEIKMQQFEELDSLLEAERRSIEAGRRQLYLDRLAVQRQLGMVTKLLRKAQMNPSGLRLADVQEAASGAIGLPGQGTVVREAMPYRLRWKWAGGSAKRCVWPDWLGFFVKSGVESANLGI